MIEIYFNQLYYVMQQVDQIRIAKTIESIIYKMFNFYPRCIEGNTATLYCTNPSDHSEDKRREFVCEDKQCRCRLYHIPKIKTITRNMTLQEYNIQYGENNPFYSFQESTIQEELKYQFGQQFNDKCCLESVSDLYRIASHHLQNQNLHHSYYDQYFNSIIAVYNQTIQAIQIQRDDFIQRMQIKDQWLYLSEKQSKLLYGFADPSFRQARSFLLPQYSIQLLLNQKLNNSINILNNGITETLTQFNKMVKNKSQIFQPIDPTSSPSEQPSYLQKIQNLNHLKTQFKQSWTPHPFKNYHIQNKITQTLNSLPNIIKYQLQSKAQTQKYQLQISDQIPKCLNISEFPLFPNLKQLNITLQHMYSFKYLHKLFSYQNLQKLSTNFYHQNLHQILDNLRYLKQIVNKSHKFQDLSLDFSTNMKRQIVSQLCSFYNVLGELRFKELYGVQSIDLNSFLSLPFNKLGTFQKNIGMKSFAIIQQQKCQGKEKFYEISQRLQSQCPQSNAQNQKALEILHLQCYQLSFDDINLIVRDCRYLLQLNFNNVIIKDQHITLIVKYLTKLQKLTMNKCRLTAVQIECLCYKQSKINLKVLSINQNYIGYKAFQSIIQTHHHLEEISIIQQTHQQPINEKSFINIGKHLPNLHVLTLSSATFKNFGYLAYLSKLECFNELREDVFLSLKYNGKCGRMLLYKYVRNRKIIHWKSSFRLKVKGVRKDKLYHNMMIIDK